MDKNTRNMINTMQDMLRNEGYSVIIAIKGSEYVATVPAMRNNAIMRLHYPLDTMTPGEVVFAVRDILDTLNGKGE